MVTERCELEMHSVRNACVSGMDHVYHSCLDKTAHTKTKCNEAVSTVINGGTCDVLQGNEGFLYIHTYIIQGISSHKTTNRPSILLRAESAGQWTGEFKEFLYRILRGLVDSIKRCPGILGYYCTHGTVVGFKNAT